jgi:hypothetical protein
MAGRPAKAVIIVGCHMIMIDFQVRGAESTDQDRRRELRHHRRADSPGLAGHTTAVAFADVTVWAGQDQPTLDQQSTLLGGWLRQSEAAAVA